MSRLRKKRRKVGPGGVVDTSSADLAALSAIAAASIGRAHLLAGGYRALLASSDLHPHGYTVRHWLIPGVPGSEVLEYNPSMSGLPRLTAADYAGQAAIHRALGLNLVPPGECWADYRQRGLFDEALAG